MAQTNQLLNFEPWLKPPKNGHLSHGSNPHLTCRFSHENYRTNILGMVLMTNADYKMDKICDYKSFGRCP